jgi:hypothetical protein
VQALPDVEKFPSLSLPQNDVSGQHQIAQPLSAQSTVTPSHVFDAWQNKSQSP